MNLDKICSLLEGRLTPEGQLLEEIRLENPLENLRDMY